MRVVVGVLAVLLAAFLGAIGIILILYRGEALSEGDVDVEIGDVAVDADIIGAALLLAAAVAIVLGIRFAKHR